MAGSPRWKVFNPSGVYQASCHEPEAAAVLAVFYGDGATIRDGHRKTVWTEGATGDGCAAESFDGTAETIRQRAGGTA